MLLNIDKVIKCIRESDEPKPELMKRFPGGFYVPDLTKGLDEFLAVEDELLSKGATSAIAWREKIDKERQQQSPQEKK